MKRMNRKICWMLGFFLLAGSSTFAQGQDVKGGKDHPLLTRMPNFYISDYKNNEFDTHKFLKQDKIAQAVEGHLYYIEYHLNAGGAEPGELKIRRNVQDALKKVGGTVIFDDNFNKTSTITVKKDNKETWVEVRSYNNMYRIYIVEREIMKQEIVANAEAMENDITALGHVSVYGIFFDTGKSDLKPESSAALAEIAKLLQNNNTLKLYVVGHTDNVGTFESNMTLSKARADAVVRELVTKYSIAADRLKAYGVSSLSPVASNKTEDGKAKNKRVELVEQ